MLALLVVAVCTAQCPSRKRSCNDGSACIWDSYFCNGVTDCADRSDEVGCTTTVVTTTTNNGCTGDVFVCADLTKCVAKQYTCNGFNDCRDGSDEADCTSITACVGDVFICADLTKCVAKQYACNGFNDCRDGSDERGCTTNTATTTTATNTSTTTTSTVTATTRTTTTATGSTTTATSTSTVSTVTETSTATTATVTTTTATTITTTSTTETTVTKTSNTATTKTKTTRTTTATATTATHTSTTGTGTTTTTPIYVPRVCNGVLEDAFFGSAVPASNCGSLGATGRMAKKLCPRMCNSCTPTTSTTTVTTTTYKRQSCNGVLEAVSCGRRIMHSDCTVGGELEEYAKSQCPQMCGLVCTTSTTSTTATTATTATSVTTTTVATTTTTTETAETADKTTASTSVTTATTKTNAAIAEETTTKGLVASTRTVGAGAGAGAGAGGAGANAGAEPPSPASKEPTGFVDPGILLDGLDLTNATNPALADVLNVYKEGNAFAMASSLPKSNEKVFPAYYWAIAAGAVGIMMTCLVWCCCCSGKKGGEGGGSGGGNNGGGGGGGDITIINKLPGGGGPAAPQVPAAAPIINVNVTLDDHHDHHGNRHHGRNDDDDGRAESDESKPRGKQQVQQRRDASPTPPFAPAYQATGTPDWLHGQLSKDAVKALFSSHGGKDGTYLLCEYEDPAVFVLYVVYNARPTSHKVLWDRTRNVWTVNKKAYGNFDDLRALVHCLQDPPASIKWPAPLRYPVAASSTGGKMPSSEAEARLTRKGQVKLLEGVTTDSTTDELVQQTTFGVGVEGCSLYQNAGFRGWCATFGEGKYDSDGLVDKGAANDEASSLRVSPGYEASVFQMGDFTGGVVHFPEGEYDLDAFQRKGAPNDQVSALVVRKVGSKPWGAGLARPIWLHEYLEKEATEALLKAPGSGDGTFLVSKHKGGNYCLAVLHQGKLTRHNVAREKDDVATRDTWFVGNPKKPQRAGATTSLADAITWLTDRDRCKLARWPAPLLYPVPHS